MKKFEKNDIKVLNEVLSGKIVNIFYQPLNKILDDDIFVFNFTSIFGKEYSLQVKCFVRIYSNNEILLTSSDIYFSPDCTQKQDQDTKKICLLDTNLKRVRELLLNCIVKTININDIGDILIQFSNNITLEITLDCLYEKYEYYRFFEINNSSFNYIVLFNDGKIMFEKTQG